MTHALPTLGGFKLTARTDAPDFRDYTYEPALVPLKPRMPPPSGLWIRDQGQTGACTGFGLAAAIDRLIAHTRRRPTTAATAVSTRMLYVMARRYDEWRGDDYEGSSCRGAIKGWYNMGVCLDKLYPFEQDSGEPPPAWDITAAKDARNRTVGAYYRLGQRISDYHAALNEVGAIFCSAQLHAGWESPDPESGEIVRDSQPVGGHAFAIVGYDADGFWVQNSWGAEWGRTGTALWTYEDWQLNVQDAWVFQMALPTPQIWHLPPRRRSHVATAEKNARPARAEIAGHFVHIDDGEFHENGRYWSNLEDVRLTARLVAESDKYDHLLFYAHGGLNRPAASARRIAAMKETFKKNRIYPYHLMYDTGLLEELKDVIIGRRNEAEERAGGFSDWIDRLVEKLTRVPGRALWREMKAGARSPFDADRAGSMTLRAFVDALTDNARPLKIHIAGHSTGMILMAWLLQRLAELAPQRSVDTASLLAPAGTVDLFTGQVQPFLKAPYPEFRISEMTIYNLTDELEQDDEVTRAYNKSLLYLVSNAFEEPVPRAPILGMENFSKTVGRRKLPRLTIHYSKGDVPGARVSASESHGGFDNDPLTMNHVLRRILRSANQTPVQEFTRESLDY
ncbi:C1 family peptidase [Elongatibacter sediminis]|uniref:C1 family peptidase n=1 Tax=Elongatibacter sediminis TaxID=3119006 RepID=A0AAW9RCM5_9GAMM